MTARTDAERPHIPVLDGVRGLAILLVLVFHFGCVYDRAALLRHWWTRLASAGWCGVDLFFVLSGCLITGILLDAKGRPGYFRNFYARRALRIFPLYYGFLLLIFLTRPLFPLSAGELIDLHEARWWLGVYGQNLWVAFASRWLPQVVNHLWSLAVEEQFYLLWPLVVLMCSRRGLAWVCGGVLAGCLTFRFWLTFTGGSPVFTYVFTFTRMDGFAAGAAVALAVRSGIDPVRLRAVGRAIAVGCFAALAVYFRRRGYLAWNGPWVQTYGYSVLAIGFAGLLLWSLTAGPAAWVRRSLSLRPLRWLARYSYGIYVLHFPLVPLFEAYARLDRVPPAWRATADRWLGLVVLVAGSAISIALAGISWHLYEKHFLRLKVFFPQNTVRAVPAAESAVRRAA